MLHLLRRRMLRRPIPQQSRIDALHRDRVVRRRARGLPLRRLALLPRDELDGVLVRGLELVDERALVALALLALFFLLAAELGGARLAVAALEFFLFFEGVGVGFFALLVELDERLVFSVVGFDACFGGFAVDVVDEVEGWEGYK